MKKLLVFFAAAVCALAVETETWQTADFSDFDKGTITHLSLSSDGILTLAPAVKEIFDASTEFLWAVARDSQGNVYAGGGGLGGSKAKLFKIDPQGKVKTLAELEGVAIQAIAIDPSGRVYAATSPDGKVYRVNASGKAEPFYDPKAKYIWAMVFDKSGNLYIATGDQGEIHRVTPSGAGSVFFRTGETHARSLTLDPNGNLIAGTDPDGLILRITPAGKGFVLYQASKREITAVAAAPDGTIYAAGIGNKQPALRAAPQPAAPRRAQTSVSITVTPSGVSAPRTAAPAPAPAPVNLAAAATAGGSEIYRIQPDGDPSEIWSNSQDLVYSLAFDAQGRLIAGTGNHGALYRIDSDHSYTRLLKVASMQITGLCSGQDGKLYAVTGNIGKIFSVGPDSETSGTYESDVLDAGGFSYWGRLSAEPQDQTGVSFEARSGNVGRPEENWSPWAKLNAGRIVSPPARFLQYRATLSGAAPGTARIEEIDAAYQTKNAAPIIKALEITPPNYKFPPQPAAPTATSNPQTLVLPALGRKAPAPRQFAANTGNSPALTWAKGQIGVRWLADDDNDDSLTFKLEIRGVHETGWKLLADKIREQYYSWDSSAFPDGNYVVRITASDEPSNPPDQALTSSRESDPFRIDNTPPEITGLTAAPSGSKIEVRFNARDALSLLDKAEYSVNGGSWMILEPTTRLTDSNAHDYRVLVDKPKGETTIAVRVSDEFENQSVAKTTVQ